MKSKICGKCNNKTKRRKLLEFEGIQLCIDCYNGLTKQEKIELVYLGGRVKLKLEGFLIGGIIGGFLYSSGYNSGARWMNDKIIKKYNITKRQLDEKSIELYDMHYWMCDEKQQCKIFRGLGIKRGW